MAAVPVVGLVGELDLAGIAVVDAALDPLDPADDVIVDLSEATFIDSVTLARFVAAARRHDSSGGRFVLAEARSRTVRKVLAITQIDRVLPYTDTVLEAQVLLGEDGVRAEL